MTIIVEDGSIVANANSYVSLSDARAYATQRGESLPTNDAELEALLIIAKDFLESYRNKYQGNKVSSSQSLQWPRHPVYIDGFLIDNDLIPAELIAAQCQLAIDQNNGIDIEPTKEGGFVIKEKVGPLETDYSERVGTSTTPTLTAVDRLLEPLLKTTGSGLSLFTMRV